MNEDLTDGLQKLSRIEARPTHEEIAVLAYSIWEGEGKPNGHDIAVKIWLEAKSVLSKHGPEPASSQRTPQQDLGALKVKKKP